MRMMKNFDKMVSLILHFSKLSVQMIMNDDVQSQIDTCCEM